MDSTWVLWAILVAYGLGMWLISPRVRQFGEFFAGRKRDGSEVGQTLLIASIVISWIFAKSITNAANLGRTYGLVGAVAYAGWYLSIPVAGLVIYWIRIKLHSSSLTEFIVRKYGRAAAGAFLLVVLFRLVNEVWSNTAVVGAYFGEAGSAPYFGAALGFAALTLAYSLRGGLRSSIVTDLIQFGLGLFLLFFVLALILPETGPGPLFSSGEWTLAGGVDLLLVAVLQSLSYPFHDPVLTDRAFITSPKAMLRAYFLAGAIAAAFIVLFGLVGVHAREVGLDVAGQDTPLRVAGAFGVAATVVMTVLMMVSAGSTLDSTLASFGKAAVVDVGGGEGDADGALSRTANRWLAGRSKLGLGRWTMVGAVVVGSLPLFAGAPILKATTISGTMVLGLAPPFLLFFWRRANPLAFHLGFWPGVVVGVLFTLDAVPASWALGDGSYALLLGANVYGTLIAFGGYAVGAVVGSVVRVEVAAASTGAVLLATLLVPSAARGQSAPPQEPEDQADVMGLSEPMTRGEAAEAGDDTAPLPPPPPDRPALRLGGQTMLRLTWNLDDLERPSSEIYNVRVVGEAELDPVRFLAEVRFRNSNLRTFSPSNVWLQQAYARWDTPLDGLSVSGGLLYNQLGLFWDGSWFGNLPYLNGHKLDPDMNLELLYDRQYSDAFRMQLWLQGSPGEDGLNGTFATAGKLARLLLPPDPETAPGHREALAARARLVATFTFGDFSVVPGASVQYSVIDRSASDGVAEATGSQLVAGGELTLRYGPASLFGEVLVESIDDLLTESLDRTYVLAGAEVDVFRRSSHQNVFSLVRLGASWSRADYSPEDFDEWFLTARVFVRVHELIGTTVEYVRWQLSDADDTELDRFEMILHVYY